MLAKLEDTVGLDNLLSRDRKTAELKEEAFTAFGDDSEPSSSSSSSSKAALAVAEPAQRQQPQRGSGPASARADKLRSEAGTPQRAREAIDAGLQKFAAGEYQTAVDLFQLSLELPGSGVMRMSGSVREYSCASEGEENAALYNMACCYAALGQKQAALTVLEALLDNEFDQVATIRSDADLAPLRGPDLDKLLSKHDGLLSKVFGRKKKDDSSANKPWLRW
ncbi:Tetratricopeptide-like helical [Micractinium conductrix]|uniref:Tetratricopeptide-like helical n=1 Tax=Micractinium conductrix TaxID=554055 RepID=A0A2P6VAI4_9CHLO|nr:Tetratricopeptide-like helical [Micractinium conductrix]|eukprot:PSC71097.1 Tetratricopeptide-like helical [Micractinium conductrix]